MADKNPYTTSFGRIPKQYISRDALIDNIIDIIDSDIVTEQAFKLTGIRGTGKTVTLTAIERRIEELENWIVIDLKPDGDITRFLIEKLYSQIPFLTEYIDASLNLSAFGIGLNLTKKSPITNQDVALEMIMDEIQKKGRRVLLLIDEVRKTSAMIDFIQEFQILIRKEYPIYLIIAGLYDDVDDIENTDGLTFFLRAERYEMKPLNTTIIREDYKKTIGLDHDTADKLALMTKGYAFAYQVFGKYMWDMEEKSISDAFLARVDDVLSERVYEKIWSELSKKDKWYMRYIIKKDSMQVSELLELTKSKHNEWSVPRKHLIEKGIIDGKERGIITIRLPRFKEFVENLALEEM